MTNDTMTHLRIIRTWAEVDGKSGRGIDPVCCADIVKWIDEALKELKPVKPHRCVLSRLGSDVMECHECGSCGKVLQPCDKYCWHCGKAVKWDG